MKKPLSPEKAARGIMTLLAILFLASACFLCYRTLFPREEAMVAEIYQNGKLISSIPLWNVTETQEFTITGENGAENIIRVAKSETDSTGPVSSGTIGIVHANCPDKLCVKQGMKKDDLIPITCLPNHLVIKIKKASPSTDDAKMDAVTF